jgi:hypothetical protein
MEKKLASQEATMVPLDRSWLPLSQSRAHHPEKKEWFTHQDMYSKRPTSNRSWYFPISKPCSRATDLHVSVKEIPPTASWHWADSDKHVFQLFMPWLTPVSPLESKAGLLGWNLPINLRTLENDHCRIYIQCAHHAVFSFILRQSNLDRRHLYVACIKISCRESDHW